MIGKTERNESRGSLSRNLVGRGGEWKSTKRLDDNDICTITSGRRRTTTSFDVVVVYICVVSSSRRLIHLSVCSSLKDIHRQKEIPRQRNYKKEEQGFLLFFLLNFAFWFPVDMKKSNGKPFFGKMLCSTILCVYWLFGYSIIHIDDGGDQKQRPRFFLYRQKDMRAIFWFVGVPQPAVIRFNFFALKTMPRTCNWRN